jgi:hypothetical protein
MKLALIAAAVFLMAGASIPTVVYADDDDGASSQSSEGTPVNPCAPETYDANECVTPE